MALAAEANAQSLLSCKTMTWQSSLDTKEYSYFFEASHLNRLRATVQSSFQVVHEFQQFRAQEIRAETQRLINDPTALNQFLEAFSVAHHDLRVSMAIGFRPALAEEYLNSDFRYFLNTNMDMTYFRALPIKTLEPLTRSEIEKGVRTLREFFTLEMNLFQSLLARNNAGLASNHPLVRLQVELQNTQTLGEKLLNPNRTLQSYMVDKLREFRAQQRELALMAILRIPPLAYTVVQQNLTSQRYQQAVNQIIQNGNDEVQKLRDSLDMWLSDQQFSRLSANVERRELSHKRATVANALSKLEALFEYIPALEEAVLINPNSCEVAERALAIHFRRLSNQQIGNMVLMVAALAVAPMITGPILLTSAVVGGTALSVYTIHQENSNYQQLVRATLTEINPQNVDPQIYADLQAIEANIVTQQLFLPTLLPTMGLGLKSMASMVRLKSLL